MQSYSTPTFSEINKVEKIKAVLPEIDRLYKEHSEKIHYPGYAYSVIADGKVIHSKGYGFANIEKKIAATPNTLFRIASMTKSFTAMAIVKLRDEGKLRLDDPVFKYIPEIKNQKLTKDTPDITIRDLLTHSGGFPTDDPWADRKLDETDQQLVDLIKNGLFYSTPSCTDYEYSNLGYTMLGFIISRVSGIPYGTYILDQICKPLGMDEAAWEYTNVDPAKLAQGYRWINENLEVEPLLKHGIYGAMGGLIASVESYSRYIALHLSAYPPRDDNDNGPVSRSSLREMQRPWKFNQMTTLKTIDGKERTIAKAYGYGLTWTKDTLGNVYVGHSGGLPGFGSNWVIMPECGIGVMLLANVTYAYDPVSNINLNVMDLIVKRSGLKPLKANTSGILKLRKKELERLLPDWEKARKSGIFAANFFLDNPLDQLQKSTSDLFKQAGKIVSVSDMTADNQLSGVFSFNTATHQLQVKFALTPENPPLIQHCKLSLHPRT